MSNRTTTSRPQKTRIHVTLATCDTLCCRLLSHMAFAFVGVDNSSLSYCAGLSQRLPLTLLIVGAGVLPKRPLCTASCRSAFPSLQDPSLLAASHLLPGEAIDQRFLRLRLQTDLVIHTKAFAHAHARLIVLFTE